MSITPENPETSDAVEAPHEADAELTELSAAPQDIARGIVPVVAVNEAPEPFDHDHQSGGGSF